MSNLEQHIARLLVHHNCVILPRFGGLIASYQSSRINEESGIIAPPFKEIIFNKSLSHNDGLLINSYSQEFKLSYSEAEKMVASLVSDIQLRLSKGDSVALGNIGVFRMDGQDNIHFKQDDSINLLGQSFGFEAIQMVPLSTGAQRAFESRTRSRAFVRLVTNSRVAATLAASIGLFLFSTNINVKELDNYNYSSMFTSSDSKEIVSTLQISEPLTVAITLEEKGNYIHPASAIKEMKSNSYHLIAGSVKTQEEAKQMLKVFKQLGKSDALIVQADGRYRLSLEQFASKEIALISMKEYRNSSRYRDVWIYHEK